MFVTCRYNHANYNQHLINRCENSTIRGGTGGTMTCDHHVDYYRCHISRCNIKRLSTLASDKLKKRWELNRSLYLNKSCEKSKDSTEKKNRHLKKQNQILPWIQKDRYYSVINQECFFFFSFRFT